MTGPRAMLASTLDPDDLGIVSEPAWALQRKWDGRRKLVVTGPEGPRAFNREGRRAELPATLAREVEVLEHPAILDGEWAQDCFHLFDLPLFEGVVDDQSSWARRDRTIRRLLDAWSPDDTIVQRVDFVAEPAKKMELLATIEEAGGEGCVFKRMDSSYEPGVRSRHWLKMKFQEDLDLVVVAVGANGKRNLTLALFDDCGGLLMPGGGRGREVARCSALTGDGPSIRVGDVVTVTVTGIGVSGRLIEPRTPRRREDKPPSECAVDQLLGLREISR